MARTCRTEDARKRCTLALLCVLAAAVVEPTLGQHTDDILRDEPGLSDQRIAELRAGRVI